MVTETTATARQQSLIMCEWCGLGFPGREIANLGSLAKPEWVCADCLRAVAYLERTDHPTMPVDAKPNEQVSWLPVWVLAANLMAAIAVIAGARELWRRR